MDETMKGIRMLEYLRLEKEAMDLDDQAEKLRERMDVLWRGFSDEEHEKLDEREVKFPQRMPSEGRAIDKSGEHVLLQEGDELLVRHIGDGRAGVSIEVRRKKGERG